MKPFHVLILLTIVSHNTFNGTKLTVALHALQLGASPAIVGVLVAMFGLVPMLISVHAGRWIDRIGPKVPILAATTILSMGALASFALESISALLLTSLLTGMGYNIFFVAQQQLIGRYGRPEELPSILSLSSLGFSLSSFISPVISGFSIDHAGAPNTFLLLGLLPCITLVVVASNRLKFPPRHASSGSLQERPKGGVIGLLRQPELRRVYIFSTLSQATWDTFNVLMPIYGSQNGHSASTVGLLIGTFAFATLIVRVAMPMIVRHTRPWQLLIISVGGSSLSFFCIPATNGIPALLALAAWLGLTVGLAAPMLLTLIHDASPPDRIGEAVGLRVSMMNTSQTAIPMISGSVAAALGVGTMFLATGMALVAGCVYCRGRWHARRPGSAGSNGFRT